MKHEFRALAKGVVGGEYVFDEFEAKTMILASRNNGPFELAFYEASISVGDKNFVKFVSDEEFETIKELYYSSEKEAIILEKKIYDYQNLIPHLDNDNSFDDFEEVNQFLKATKGDEDGVKKSNIKMSVVVNEDIDSMR